MSNQSPEPPLVVDEQLTIHDSNDLEVHDPMAEYYQLQQKLLLYTLALMGIIFVPVWYFYSLNIALNYLLGAGVGLVYLRMLGKEVESLGQPEQRLGVKGLGIFIILIIVASKWQQLHILPVFLGFLTYKPAIVIYTFESVFGSAKTKDNQATNK
ncbi:ATP synthase I [Chondrocystis sp. NIES-4102]|nr:ATP synthase I [Chondrocystis sp. NIES-4102]